MNSLAIKNTQHIYDLVNLCAQYGVEKAVVCPGSRCAPLLIGFGKHPDIETISITDERSAGFIGLGIAQQSGSPVALVCTSGTAAQNFAPAVTEAYYQQVPLIVLTADRPPEWIDQWEGQTIHQEKLYNGHVKGSFIFDKNRVKIGHEAIKLALSGAPGPVHLNVPIHEPFYPEPEEEIIFKSKVQNPVIEHVNSIENEDWNQFKEILNSAEKIMILGGQMSSNRYLETLLNQLDVSVVGDVISNLHGVDGVIQSGDLIFKKKNEYTEDLSPDLLVTFGRSIISKNLKLFFRTHKPKHHWHIGLGMVGDPFQSLTKVITVNPELFFEKWVNEKDQLLQNVKSNYWDDLNNQQLNVKKTFNKILAQSEFNYFSAVQKVIEHVPKNSTLHLGNSMPVRIANFIGIQDSTVEVRCNRGTSGIDGVVSTAVGHALGEPKRKHTLIIGDLSFFYDRNGLWLNHEFPSNLQIVILNDSGGGIFNMIPGPSNQEGLTDLFTTPHRRTAELTAKEFGLVYSTASSLEEIHNWEPGILEIFTDMETNAEIFN